MKKENIVYGLVGLALGVGVMYFFGDKIKSLFSGFSSAPAKAK